MKYFYLTLIYIIFCISAAYCTYTANFYEVTKSTCGNNTLLDIRTLIRDKVKDPSNSFGTTRYTDAQLNNFINMAQKEICINTGFLKATCTGALTAYTTEYYLPTNMLFIERVQYGNEDTLNETTMAQLDNDSNGWFSVDASSPTAYYQMNGLQKIAFYPPPLYSNIVVTIYYAKIPTNMINDTDEIFESDPKLDVFKDVIVMGALTNILFLENDSRWASMEQKYMAYLERIKSQWNVLPNYKPGVRIKKI